MGLLLYDTRFVSFLVWKETTSLKHPEKYLVKKKSSHNFSNGLYKNNYENKQTLPDKS